MNAFVKSIVNPSYDALTANGAVSHSTSGSAVLDYFSKCSTYSKRDDASIASDMAKIFAEDEKLATKVLFYNRLVTRSVKGKYSTDKVQRGQGMKDEFIRSLKWISVNRPAILKKNLRLIPSIGCWKDLWYDSPVTGLYFYPLPEEVYKLIKLGMKDEYNRGLLAKYLPKLRSRSNTTNERHKRINKWVRGLLAYLKWTPEQYRKFKSNPDNVAHLWQRQMSAGEWDSIDFNTVPGKALFKLVNNTNKAKVNAITRHGLEKDFMKWMEAQPTAKFTGYVYELFKAANTHSRNAMQTLTLNKQFDGLIETARKDVSNEILNRGVLCALDISSSMTYPPLTTSGATPYHICLGLGIFFSCFMKGAWKDIVCEFSDRSKLTKLSGTFCDRVQQVIRTGGWGSTNFQSVIDTIVDFRKKNPNVPISDYPEVILVASDMQFNPANSYSYRYSVTEREVQTNYEVAMKKLTDVGLPKMTIIWWNLNGQYGNDVPSKMDDEGTVLVSGFDPSIVSAILGAEKVVDKTTGEVRKANPYEVMVAALDQTILNKLKV